MQWPSRAEYTEAVRDYPHVSLQDPELTGGEPRRGRDNFVVSDTGAFSIDFFRLIRFPKLSHCDVGLKTLVMPRISTKRYLLTWSRFVYRYFVDFEYVPQGILVKGPVYPITRMEWIDGVSTS